MFWNYIAFVLVIIAIMVLSHSLIYLTSVHLLGLTSLIKARWLVISLSLMAVGLVLASILVHLIPGKLTRLFYGACATWYGLVACLVLVSFALCMLKVLSLVLPGLPPHVLRYIALGAYTATVLYVGLCVYWAHGVQITRVTVPLHGLPNQWHRKTIVHLSDLHIGGYWDENFLYEIVSTVNQLQPELIVITGDLFDGSSSHHWRYFEALSGFRARNGVFFVSGNHEVYAGIEGITKVVTDAGIDVLDNRIVQIKGLQLIGVASPSAHGNKRPPFVINSHPNFDPILPSVLLFHMPTDIPQITSSPTMSGSNAYLAPETNFGNVIEAGISLQLSGHTHAGQWFPFTAITRWIYGGFHYGLHRIGDFYIYISAGTGTWGPLLRSGHRSEIALITLVTNY